MANAKEIRARSTCRILVRSCYQHPWFSTLMTGEGDGMAGDQHSGGRRSWRSTSARRFTRSSSSSPTGLTARPRGWRRRGYCGTSPPTPPARHRARQRRTVRVLTPNRRPAAVGPWWVAYSSHHPVPHSDPLLRPDLHVTQFDHRPPPRSDRPRDPSNQERSILGRYFTTTFLCSSSNDARVP